MRASIRPSVRPQAASEAAELSVLPTIAGVRFSNVGLGHQLSSFRLSFARADLQSNIGGATDRDDGLAYVCLPSALSVATSVQEPVLRSQYIR